MHMVGIAPAPENETRTTANIVKLTNFDIGRPASAPTPHSNAGLMDMTIDAHVGVADRNPDFFVRVTNPVRETLQVDMQSMEAGRYNIEIYSMDGRRIARFEEDLDEGTHRFSYPFKYGKGAYLVRFQNDKGQKIAKKVVCF